MHLKGKSLRYNHFKAYLNPTLNQIFFLNQHRMSYSHATELPIQELNEVLLLRLVQQLLLIAADAISASQFTGCFSHVNCAFDCVGLDTSKDDREPLWLLTLRMTNNTVTLTSLQRKPSMLHSKNHNFTQLQYLRKAQPIHSSQYTFHNKADSWMAKKRHTCNPNTLNVSWPSGSSLLENQSITTTTRLNNSLTRVASSRRSKGDVQ
jgi:hypothetical protein